MTVPETLVKYDAPLFAGIESNTQKTVRIFSRISSLLFFKVVNIIPWQQTKPQVEINAKLDDMVNSMLPPRYVK